MQGKHMVDKHMHTTTRVAYDSEVKKNILYPLPAFILSIALNPSFSLSLSLALLNSLMWFWAWILNEKCITTLLFSLSSSLYVSFTILYFNPSLHDRTGDRQNQALCRPLVILLSGTSLLPLSSLLPLFLSPCFFFFCLTLTSP